MEFKDRIKELRLEHALTQAQLASTIEKGEAAIRTWESGRAKPDSDTLIKLARFFNCSVDYLLGISSTKKTSHLLELDSEINRVNRLLDQKRDEFSQIELRQAELEELLDANRRQRLQIMVDVQHLSAQAGNLKMQKKLLLDTEMLQTTVSAPDNPNLDTPDRRQNDDSPNLESPKPSGD